MTGRVLPFGASTHAAADALLPFYVNGTLRGEELAFVEQHVRACEQCQHEVDWLRKTFAALAADVVLQEAPRVVSSAAQQSENGGRQHSGTARVQGRLRTTHSWTRWLLAAQLAAIVVLGTLLATDTRDVASYRTLGVSNPSAQLHDAIAVKFDPAITESEMQRVVLGVGARIVDGPTSTDVYVLEIPAEGADRALQALRTDRAVRLAERLGPRTGR
jgi:anti-sigma-K factor RskA